MTNQDSQGGSGVNVVAIIAILVLVGLAAWFFLARQQPPAEQAVTPAPAPTETKTDNDVDINVNLPDTVNINP